MDGFKYLMKKLGRKSDFVHTGLIMNEVSIKKADELQEEEQAKNIKIVNLPG
jgi:hypothetical protein